MRKSKIDGKFPTQSSLLETTSRGLKPRISRLRVPRIGEMESLKVPNWWPSLRPRLCLSRPSDLETGMRPRPSQGGLAMAELPLEGVGSCKGRPTRHLFSSSPAGLHRVALPRRNTVRGLRPRPPQGIARPHAALLQSCAELRLSTTLACSALPPAGWDLQNKLPHVLPRWRAFSAEPAELEAAPDEAGA